MRTFVSTLLLCLIALLLYEPGAQARSRHHATYRHRHHASVHVVKHKLKLFKQERVVRSEPEVCLFFCRAQQLTSDVASYGAPSPWRAMRYKDTPIQRDYSGGVGPRPRAWCGWWIQTGTGITSAISHLNLNMAIEWARVGHATTPHVGAIVVWRHHVGKITGVASNGRFLVMSGNSGGHRGHRTVTEHPRSLSGAVAIREL